MARSMSLKGSRYFIVGRNGAQADVVVADASVSRAHAVIINSSSATFVHDLDSAQGTYYDEDGRTNHVAKLGRKLDAEAEPTKLREGGSLRFGTHSATVFRIVGLEAEKVQKWPPPAWAAPPGRALELEVRSNHVANPYLEHLADGTVDQRLPLSTPCTRFGRTAALVDHVVADASISRQHAAIVHTSERESYLFDLGSASGSFVDATRVEPNQPVLLTDGAVISLGVCPATYTFRVVRDATAPSGGKRKR